MKKILALWLTLAGMALAQIPLLSINSPYRIVDLQPNNHGVGVALPQDNPSVEQNFMFFTLDTKVNLEIIRPDGSRKVFPATLDKFWKLARVGNIVKVKAERAWDGQIQADEIWLEHHGDVPN